MKNLLVILTLILGLQLNAQTKIGVKTHYGTAWQEYGALSINGFDQRIRGFGVALEVSHPLNDRFQMMVSPGYVRRGAACEPGFINELRVGNSITDASIYCNYIEMPISVQYKITKGERLSTFAQFGAGFSYMLSGYRIVKFFGNLLPDERIELDFETEKTLNRYDLGLHTGVGISYKVGEGSIQLSANYYHGMIDVTDNNTSKNRTINVGLGYTFFIDGKSTVSVD